MRRALALLFVLCLVAVPVRAAKVNIDYAEDFDFEKVETFQYVDTPESNLANPLMAERVANLIRQKLKEGGLKEVDADPGMYITYHFTTKDRLSIQTHSYGYGGGYRYHRWGGGWGNTYTTATQWTEGTLIIDAYDPDEKMVWRGTGTVAVKEKPENQLSQVENILKKLGNRWRKILRNRGK